MKPMTRFTLSLAGALLMAAPALAQTKWNLPAAYPPDNFHTENLNAFSKDVADATGGKLQITPPVGFNLFVLQNMSGRDSFTIARAALPFFFLLVAAVAIIPAFPNIVLWLPRLAFPQ